MFYTFPFVFTICDDGFTKLFIQDISKISEGKNNTVKGYSQKVHLKISLYLLSGFLA